MRTIAEAAIKMLKSGTCFAQATILTSSGSTPRNAGASMLISPDKSIVGTVGGGVLEAHIQKTAQRVLENGISVVEEYVLEQDGAAAIGAICGGRAEVLIEYIRSDDIQNTEYFEQLLNAVKSEKRSYIATLIPNSGVLLSRQQCLISPDGTIKCAETLSDDMLSKLQSIQEDDEDEMRFEDLTVYRFPVGSDGTVFIFGAGHCGEKLAHILHTVAFGTVIIDDRAEFANSARFPEADQIIIPASIVDPFDSIEFSADSYIVIVTRGHVHDELVLRKALRINAAYVGMIGSKKKRETIYQHMLDDGFTQEDISKVHSPIGISIGADTPEEIAISIAAEMIKVRAEKKA